MIILAIDPGKTLGYALYNQRSPEPFMAGGEVKSVGEVVECGEAHDPDVIVIETIVPYSQPLSQDVIDTCIQIGELRAEFPDAYLISRREIKSHLLGKSTGNDTEVRRALIDRHGEQGTVKAKGPLFGVKGHIFAALAIATVAGDQLARDKGEGKKFAKCFDQAVSA